MARELLGPHLKAACLELNASDDRGIDVVRNKIKSFAQTKVTLPEGRHKIIILDEADSMTEGAQQALRRTMEVYSSTTRFALACNQSDKIIEPIQSRCAMVRYQRLTDAQLLLRLEDVAKAEAVDFDDAGLRAILFTAQGDMRQVPPIREKMNDPQALNNLQCTVSGYGRVTAENVYKVCDEPHPQMMVDMLRNCENGEFRKAALVVHELYRLGYSPEDIISNMFRVCKMADIPEILKLEFIKEIGKTHVNIVEGNDSLLQLTGLVASLCKKKAELDA